jgi:hypothetical protein
MNKTTRTEIQIVTHEITIIRFGRLHRVDPRGPSQEADVVTHEQPQLPSDNETKKRENEKRN